MSKTVTYLAIIFVVVILLVLVVNTIESRKMRKLMDRLYTNNSNGNLPLTTTQPTVKNPQKKTQIEALSKALASSLSGSIFGVLGETSALLQETNQLSDVELDYLANHYSNTHHASLYRDIDELLMPHTETDDQILERLMKLGWK